MLHAELMHINCLCIDTNYKHKNEIRSREEMRDKQRKTTDGHHSVIDLIEHTDSISEDEDRDNSSWNQIGYVHLSQEDGKKIN